MLPLKTEANWQNLGGARRGKRRPISQSCSLWNPSWLRDGGITRKDPESDQIWTKQADWPETIWELTPLHKAWEGEPCGRTILLGLCTLLSALFPGCLFPIRPPTLSAHVSSGYSFPSVRWVHSRGPTRGPLPAGLSKRAQWLASWFLPEIKVFKG